MIRKELRVFDGTVRLFVFFDLNLKKIFSFLNTKILQIRRFCTLKMSDQHYLLMKNEKLKVFRLNSTKFIQYGMCFSGGITISKHPQQRDMCWVCFQMCLSFCAPSAIEMCCVSGGKSIIVDFGIIGVEIWSIIVEDCKKMP